MRIPLNAALVAAYLSLACAAMAQEPEAAAPPAGEPAQPKPAKPKPRSAPKPKPKPAPQAAPAASKPELRPVREEPQGMAPASPAPPPPATFAAPPVACDPGQSVLYDGPKDFLVWVTRTGAVTIDNPLRPLTPDVTRVVQLVIGDKIATAYGRDLTSLRRGASPAALESLLGGPIRWDARLATLPDSFEIVSDANAPLAQMRFKECGIAPEAKALPMPVAKKEKKPKASRKEPAGATAGATAPAGRAAAPPRQFNMPQGAIPE
ncbi:hypothetical protein [Methylobacterium gnaphalii]|uniref:Uncharacterized protein n=1 Tax=Methylobacterium gnaphalii TaxID=1010610 RepID=A0A512JI03_9HYPH|nr:hypothetical protein [Methylobacterium gnaphalii]GEP09553.1 hypothetical protein MGN01_13980 [Methylobacterium gnaphalii]